MGNMTSICSACDRGDNPDLPSKGEYQDSKNARKKSGPQISGKLTETSSRPGLNFEEEVPDMRRVDNIKDVYQIGKELGRGAFGSVRVVKHRIAETTFAMKVIKKAKLKEKVYIDLMRQELEVSSRIKHPHIIGIKELLEDDKHVFIVMELMPGGDLLQRVTDLNAFSEQDAASVIKQTLLALNFLHENSITHRDMKIENILCLNSNNLDITKVTDFGFACQFDPQRKLNLILGSPLYMSPELCKHASYDQRVDVWSMGIITYILLSGTPPFYGQEANEMKDSICNDKLEFPSESFSNISKSAQDFITQCLIKNKNDRPYVKDILQHEWIQQNQDDYDNVHESIKINIGQQLKTFQKTNAFQQAVLNFIVGLKTSTQDLEDLNKMFLKLDVDQNGTLDKQELINGMDELLGTFETEQLDMDEFFDDLDTDGNGVIDHNEFIVASFDKKKLINKANLDLAFDIIDENADGSLSKDEIMRFFNGSDQLWQEFMDQADTDNDGQISRNEFYQAMENLMRGSLKSEILSMMNNK